MSQDLIFDKMVRDPTMQINEYDEIKWVGIDREYAHKADCAQSKIINAHFKEFDKGCARKEIKRAEKEFNRVNWTDEEIKRLVDLYFEVGTNYVYLAKVLKKEEAQVRAKLTKLRRDYIRRNKL